MAADALQLAVPNRKTDLIDNESVNGAVAAFAGYGINDCKTLKKLK